MEFDGNSMKKSHINASVTAFLDLASDFHDGPCLQHPVVHITFPRTGRPVSMSRSIRPLIADSVPQVKWGMEQDLNLFFLIPSMKPGNLNVRRMNFVVMWAMQPIFRVIKEVKSVEHVSSQKDSQSLTPVNILPVEWMCCFEEYFLTISPGAVVRILSNVAWQTGVPCESGGLSMIETKSRFPNTKGQDPGRELFRILTISSDITPTPNTEYVSINFRNNHWNRESDFIFPQSPPLSTLCHPDSLSLSSQSTIKTARKVPHYTSD
jgi:hypothetical protein